jgi:hypothetical protein
VYNDSDSVVQISSTDLFAFNLKIRIFILLVNVFVQILLCDQLFLLNDWDSSSLPSPSTPAAP